MESPGTGNKTDLFLSADIDQPALERLRIDDAALRALVSAGIPRFRPIFEPLQSSAVNRIEIPEARWTIDARHLTGKSAIDPLGITGFILTTDWGWAD